MDPILRGAAALLLGSPALAGGDPRADAGADPRAEVTAFVHVHVVPMDTERVLDDQTVVVRGGEIVAIGPAATTKAPGGATLVDGHGTAFLMPALADLHVHAKEPDDLALYVLNGVTTVLNLGGAGSSFVTQTRKRIESGELLGPTCFAAPLVNGARGGDLPTATPEEARASVRRAKQLGYEFIKVYNELSRASFLAICDEARAQGLAVVGHGVREPGLEESFEAGQVMVAHGEEYLYTILRGPGGPSDLGGVNPARVPLAVELTKKHGVYVIPNLSAYETIAAQWGKPAAVESFFAGPEAKYLRPWWRQRWRGGRYVENGGSLDASVVFLRRFTKALSDAGVPLLLGTDSPDIPGVHAGSSIHVDLRNLIESGLTPFQALSCGTRVAGEFIDQCVPDAAPFGTIEIGKRADLLLLAQNPLADVARLRAPAGVMVRGRWLPRAELDRRFAGLASLHEARMQQQAALVEAAAKCGAETAIAEYLAARDAKETAAAWVALDEEEVNERGYEALKLAKDPAAARAWFELNTVLRPDSGNAWDSLGEALLALKDTAGAVRCYRRALELDPGNGNAEVAIARLGKS